MRTSILRCARLTSAAAFLVLVGRASCFADGGPQPPPAANPKADDLVHKALQAEADGKPELRADYLKQALAADPNSAPAHWQSGEVRSGNRWLSVEAATKQSAQSGKVDEYRKLRDQTPATADDQLVLARWCAKQGLKAQEHTHLLYTLQLNPKSKEAMSKLGIVRYQGMLVPAEELENMKEELQAARAENREWKDRIAALKRRLDDCLNSTRADVMTEIRAIDDVDAIPSLETAFAKSGADLSLAVADCLKGMPQQQATNSLTRFAVLSQYEDVRHAAIQALRYRSKFAYIPILLSGLRAPISVSYDVLSLTGHTFSDRLALLQEGPERSSFAVSRQAAGFDSPIITPSNSQRPLIAPVDASPAKVAWIASEQQQKAQRIITKVAQANDRASALNDRIVTVLRDTTDQEIGSDPIPWWDWWYDYNEYYRYPEKPKNVSTDSQSYFEYSPRLAYAAPTPPDPRTLQPIPRSCFVAGTPVWTITGKMPIEAVKIGELVLSQSPETGQLAYRPVFLTTVRPPSRVVEIHLGDTVIRVTRGHPLWVDGIGWQMAKELKADQYLHTVNGPALIDSIEENGEETCYNMVVADFNTYFVSDAKVLVHDNNLRSPTAAIVPGLAQK